MKTLILGGARSGKSKRAEILAKESVLPVCYLATAPSIAGDEAWKKRITRHQQQRPKDWEVIEEPLLLSEQLRQMSGASQCLLIDCLTLWLNNVLFTGLDADKEIKKLCDALQDYQGEVILVSNEVGFGLVPETAVGRDFRDAQGRLNQHVAMCVNNVELIVAGLTLKLK